LCLFKLLRGTSDFPLVPVLQKRFLALFEHLGNVTAATIVESIETLVSPNFTQDVKEICPVPVNFANQAWLRVLRIIDVLVEWAIDTGSEC
jgi:hypothetical protein